ncbi:MAG: NAD(P)H-binding protein [Polyangiaceae bacterium]
MRLLVIGAHHGVGEHVVETARRRGFDVTEFAADVLDAQAVSRAVSGHDAVVSTLGPRRDSPPALCSEGTRNVVDAMKAHGVRRLVQVTGAMIGHPRTRLGLVYRTIAAFVPKAQIEDRRTQERLVVESGLAWTLVRPTRLTDGPPRGRWREGEDERVGAFASIARRDVASAIVSALEDEGTVGKSITLQY